MSDKPNFFAPRGAILEVCCFHAHLVLVFPTTSPTISYHHPAPGRSHHCANPKSMSAKLGLGSVRVTELKYVAGPKCPKITKTGPRCLRGGPQKVSLSKLMDKINLGTVWVAFWPCLEPCGPETVSVGPKLGSFGPGMCLAG